MSTKAIIAIDIDGTLTAVRDKVPEAVVEFLEHRVKDGFVIHFVTGRTPVWSSHLLESISFPYALSCLNGAVTFRFPGKQVIYEKTIPRGQIARTLELCNMHGAAFGLYPPIQYGTTSYLIDGDRDSAIYKHVKRRSALLRDSIIEISAPSDYPYDDFLAGRVFVRKEGAEAISRAIEHELGFHAPMMKDSVDENFFVVQVTDRGVSKAASLHHIEENGKIPIIACGDDYNDISMLKMATIAVAMADAPKEVLEVADIVAPSAKEQGIIKGVLDAIYLLNERRR